MDDRYTEKRRVFLRKIKERGFQILDVAYDGNQHQMIKINVVNTTCGHQFQILPRNIIARNVTCPICNKMKKIKHLNANSKARSVEYHKTADLWNSYRHHVYMETRKSYRKHKDEINPNNLPSGRAGTEGAYHLDHIVPIRYCFEHYVPVKVCSHPTNLQMLNWRDNVGSRDRLKEGVVIPLIFKDHIGAT